MTNAPYTTDAESIHHRWDKIGALEEAPIKRSYEPPPVPPVIAAQAAYMLSRLDIGKRYMLTPVSADGKEEYRALRALADTHDVVVRRRSGNRIALLKIDHETMQARLERRAVAARRNNDKRKAAKRAKKEQAKGVAQQPQDAPSDTPAQ